MARGSTAFATFLILCPTSFFLGMLFSAFPYDFPVLWTSVPAPEAYYDQLETHLRFIHNAPPLIPRILNIVIAVGLLGFIVKLYKPSEANMLFDGASLVLYLSGVTVYVANIVKGLRIISSGTYDEGGLTAGVDDDVIGRVDSMRVLSASHTILALVLVGVLVLQAGQWYAERKEREEVAQFQKDEAAAAEAKKNSSGGGQTSPTGQRSSSNAGKKKQ
ncbi:MAG: ph-response sensor protein [Chaenotheca gracillima]|nr:MAG: ph-response sensor protein [Chaenotheca gracillima]